jgi:hypothetical protein
MIQKKLRTVQENACVIFTMYSDCYNSTNFLVYLVCVRRRTKDRVCAEEDEGDHAARMLG